MHSRGTEETLFLGASTIAPLLRRLIPGVEITGAERLSRLSWAGTRKLSSVPARSAVVAFSAEKVYEVAERLRAVHGGAAVVLGALSPRTRNAQVELYQAGEVGHLVATDAIGMGLNMDLGHVAFTDIRKFDGRGFRELSSAEVAQIAGRAGRYRTDGTFGTLKSLGPLSPSMIEEVEQHRFPALRRLYWRNVELDFSDPDALLDSLQRPPPLDFLVQAFGEDDERTLSTLLHRDAIRRQVTTPEALALLWDVCRIPDYRKTRTGAHAELLSHIVTHLLDGGALPDAFVAERIERLDRTDGDIETLMARIAWVRTWTFVSWQRGWTDDPARWRAESGQVEDRLSDALHHRLTARFVDRRVSWVVGGLDLEGEISLEAGGVSIGGLHVGTISGWSFVPDGGGLPRIVAQAVRRRLRTEVLEQLRLLLEAPDSEIELDAAGQLSFRSAVIARVGPGPSMLEPKIRVRRTELLEPGERERVRSRLVRWRDAWVEQLFAAFERPDVERLSPAARGLLHALRSSLGTIDRHEVEDNLAQLTADDRRALARLDVRLGTHTIYVHSLLRPAAQQARARLWSVRNERRPLATAPANGRATLPVEPGEAALFTAMGFRIVGDLAIRVDVLEKVAAEGRRRARVGDPGPLDRFSSWLGTSHDGAVGVLQGLGFQVRRRADGRITLRSPRSRR
ncbi:MAG TPA: disulfide oxidoreductase [Deltaproteobacteria bacterium]|nr:disulfide oxidoreductase [Deltaproteobacteria bacterium]